MIVLVDTCVWSLAFRRKQPVESRTVDGLGSLIERDRAALIGPIRQEILSGIREASQYERLRKALSAFPDLPIGTSDFEQAAKNHNLCRSKGVQGSHTDFLICAVAERYSAPILTLDKDFSAFAEHLPIRLLSE